MHGSTYAQEFPTGGTIPSVPNILSAPITNVRVKKNTIGGLVVILIGVISAN